MEEHELRAYWSRQNMNPSFESLVICTRNLGDKNIFYYEVKMHKIKW